MKSSSSIKADKVDEALDELDEVRLSTLIFSALLWYDSANAMNERQARKHELLLAQRLTAISQDLRPSLRSHSRNAHADILAALLDHAKSNLVYEQQLLKELELVRPELKGIKAMREGVYYHLPKSYGSPGISSVANANGRTRSNSTSSTATTATNRTTRSSAIDDPGTRSMYADIGTQRSSGSSSNGDRRSINTLAKSVTLPDQRQRVNVSVPRRTSSGGVC